MFDAERLVTIARDRRHVALLPSFLACEAALGCVVVALSEGAWRAPAQLAGWMHAAVALLAAGLGATAAILASLPRHEPRSSRLRLDGDRLDIESPGRAHRFILDRRRRGWLRPVPASREMDATLVTARGDRVTVRFEDADEAHAFLTAAGVARPQRCLQWPLVDAGDWSLALRLRGLFDRRRLPLPLVVTLAVLFVVALHATADPALLATGTVTCAAMLLAAAGSLATAMALLRRPPSVSVGSDGIAVEGLGARRFIPLSALTRVEATDDGVVIHHTGARHPTTLPIARREPGTLLATRDRRELADPDEQLAMRESLMGRIRDVLEAWRAQADGAVEPPLATDDPAALASATSRRLRPTYRQASTSTTELTDLLLFARGTAEQRLAAAQALAGDPDAARDLHLALEGCADPTLTDALEELVG